MAKQDLPLPDSGSMPYSFADAKRARLMRDPHQNEEGALTLRVGHPIGLLFLIACCVGWASAANQALNYPYLLWGTRWFKGV